MMDFMDCDVPSGAAMNGTRAKEESEVVDDEVEL